MGCDEMVKRIQCRVISSVPLPTYRDTLHCPRSSNDKPDRIDEIVADDIRVNSVSRVGWLNITRALIGDSAAGHILDCYA
jgi:hypothetical protein